MKLTRHICFVLLAAAGLCLLAVSSMSCGGPRGTGDVTVAAEPSADTLALVEGLRLFDEQEYDLAREQLMVSARSGSTYIRAESFLYLNALEMELGNYDDARPWLEKYHVETVRLLRSAADSSHRMEEQAAHLQRQQDTFIAGVVIVGVILIGAAAFFARRGSRRTGGAGKDKVGKDEAGKMDAAPAQNGSPPAMEAEEFHRWLADAAIFRQSAIWDEVASLAAQKPGRDARVLTSARQTVLDDELAEVFSDFAANLRGDYPALTAGDVKLCCLSLLPLSPFGRALCFGSTETNIVKQRKHTIKKKLGGDVRGRALFEFIFEAKA